jgi:hypothetical protein
MTQTCRPSGAYPTRPPHLDSPEVSVGALSSASSSTPGAASTTSPARWTAPLLAARQVRDVLPLDGQRTEPRPVLLDQSQRACHLDRQRRSAGSDRATSRRRDEAPARSPGSRATATRNTGDRPVRAAAAARALECVLAPVRPHGPVRTHTVVGAEWSHSASSRWRCAAGTHRPGCRAEHPGTRRT